MAFESFRATVNTYNTLIELEKIFLWRRHETRLIVSAQINEVAV